MRKIFVSLICGEETSVFRGPGLGVNVLVATAKRPESWEPLKRVFGTDTYQENMS